MLLQDEADAVMLGLRFVRRLDDPTLVSAAQSAAGKLAAVLPEDLAEKARLSGLVVAPRTSVNPSSDGALREGDGLEHYCVQGVDPASAQADQRSVLGMVRLAMATERKLRFLYGTHAECRVDRVVWPVVLGFFQGGEVLAAWCELRSAFRHFRLGRIDSAQILPDRIPEGRRRLIAAYRKLEPGIDL